MWYNKNKSIEKPVLEDFVMVFERKDIDQKYKWDLSTIYADEAAFNADYALVEKQIRPSAHTKKQ